jgi:hypothetical protein
MEERLIHDYFSQGYEYSEIILMLNNRHDIKISIRTLKRRLRAYGLKRREPDFDIDVVRQKIRDLINGPGCIAGYRQVWHTLRMQGITVPRLIVQKTLQELDPEGSAEWKAHSLKRRVYHNVGPNYAWHCDGYDKLKPFGFPVHGAIDGWSRKILWLYVTRSNNSPHNIASYFIEAVQEFGGSPQSLITDLGNENGIAASAQCFFRDDLNAHRYVPSTRNQRIEGWWSHLRRSRTTWWINFFKNLEEEGKFNKGNVLECECLWFCFATLLQEDLNQMKEHWNTHRIRKSRHDTVSGRPNLLYHAPESKGGISGLIMLVPNEKLEYVKSHLIAPPETNEYQEYFEYVMEACHLTKPSNWMESLELYQTLINYAVSGS